LPAHAKLLSVRGTYKKHNAGDETNTNPESRLSAISEDEGVREG